jgi:hypothetical protein
VILPKLPAASTTMYRIVKKKPGIPSEQCPRWPDSEGGPDDTLKVIARRVTEYPVSARVIAVEPGGLTRALNLEETQLVLHYRRKYRRPA